METTSIHPTIRRIFMKFGIPVPHKVLSKREFCENQWNESYILLKGTNKV